MKSMNAPDCGSTGAALMSWFHQCPDGDSARPPKLSPSTIGSVRRRRWRWGVGRGGGGGGGDGGGGRWRRWVRRWSRVASAVPVARGSGGAGGGGSVGGGVGSAGGVVGGAGSVGGVAGSVGADGAEGTSVGVVGGFSPEHAITEARTTARTVILESTVQIRARSRPRGETEN